LRKYRRMQQSSKIQRIRSPSTSHMSSIEYSLTRTDYLFVIYVLIGLHFLSGIFVSDRHFRHALGFMPHMISLAITAYLFYFHLLEQLAPWLKVRTEIST
jgi:hypothetical protein